MLAPLSKWANFHPSPPQFFHPSQSHGPRGGGQMQGVATALSESGWQKVVSTAPDKDFPNRERLGAVLQSRSSVSSAGCFGIFHPSFSPL